MDVQVKRALNLKFKELRFTALRMHWDRTGPSGGPMDASERNFYDLIQVLELVASGWSDPSAANNAGVSD